MFLLEIKQKHGGRLPVRIKAIPEGTLVPTHNVLFTVENTDPEFPWVTNFLETVLVQVWYPLTVATSSFYQKLLLRKFLDKTSDDLSGLQFMVGFVESIVNSCLFTMSINIISYLEL
jgi:nicotinamide phosphoribosyltransferase